MENNSLLVGVGVGTLLISVSTLGLYYYNKMGAACATPVKNNKTAPDPASSSKKEDLKKYPNGKLSIFFGSQTGTAEGFARTLMEEGKKLGYDAKTVDLENFDAKELAAIGLAIFLMATYGEGEPTDNAAAFTKWLSNEGGKLKDSYLNAVKFTVFGLGNRQYEHYNKTGITTDEHLENMGANRVYALGLGDDDGTLEEDFDAWKQGLWPALAALSENAETRGRARTESNHLLEESFDRVSLQYEVVSVNGSKKNMRASVMSGTSNKINASTKYFFNSPMSTIVANNELRHGEEKVNKDGSLQRGSTRHIELDLTDTGLSYLTADNLAVVPENHPDVVAAFAEAQGYNMQDWITVEPTEDSGTSPEDFKLLFPCPCSVETLLTQYVDIQGQLRHSTLKQLIPYITDPTQKAWALKLVNNDNRAAFKTFISDSCPGISSLLCNELSSCKVPLSDLLHITSFIQPRYYTISSSSSVHPNTVHVTVSLTEFPVKTDGPPRIFEGLASSFFKRLCPKGGKCDQIRDADGTVSTSAKSKGRAKKTANGAADPHMLTSCRVFIRASTFRLPASLETPIIMCGPGTGLAPMRALLQERRFLAAAAAAATTKPPSKPIENTLYFGCKHHDVDYIYRDELEEFVADKTLSAYHTAFSRDGKEKVYVQHLLARPENAKTVVRQLCEEGAFFYVCGATAMGNDVHSTIVRLLCEQKGMNQAAAVAFVKDLQEKGRYVQELWTA